MTLETNRTDLASTRFVADVHEQLSQGQCRLRIDHFALTTNNITYGVFGDMLRYWDVFPANDSGWGRIPTWGFAEVVESASDELSVGERLFGFLPMRSETIITPGKVSVMLLRIESDSPARTTDISAVRQTPCTTQTANHSKWCCTRCSSQVS
jgi:hypothetical protein